MRKILDIEYFINVKIFQKNNFILFRGDSKTVILLWRYKKYRFINI